MNWKKIPAALTAVCLAVSCLCMTAFANDDYRNRPLIPPTTTPPRPKRAEIRCCLNFSLTKQRIGAIIPPYFG